MSRATSESVATEPPLSRTDKLQLFNDVFSGVSAFAALAAAIIASRALYTQLKAPKRDRKSSYYRALVVEPALANLPTFQARASQLLTESESNIHAAINRDASHTEVLALTGIAMRDYKALLRPVTFLLLGAAAAWRDDELQEQVRTACENLEDSVTESLSGLLTMSKREIALDELLHESVAEVLGTIVHYDLELDASE